MRGARCADDAWTGTGSATAQRPRRMNPGRACASRRHESWRRSWRRKEGSVRLLPVPGRAVILAGLFRAVSSAVEHYLDMVGVTGSIPVPPTILDLESGLGCRLDFAEWRLKTYDWLNSAA